MGKCTVEVNGMKKKAAQIISSVTDIGCDVFLCILAAADK